MSAITEIARPKVNLTLKVSGRRHDGYHEIESLIVFAAGLGDVVRLVPGAKTSLRASGPFAAAISGDNLIAAALACLAEAEPRIVLGSVVLEKHLPVAAGIGGGSADAAAVLRAVRRANPTFAEALDWHAVAASLGADVPVCLSDTSAFVTGMGERITMLPGLPRLPAVLVDPMAPAPADKTAQVFSRLAAPRALETRRPAQASGPFREAAALLDFVVQHGNDLMSAAVAVVPEIEAVRAALTAMDACAYAGLSGAGPTCFGIFESEAAAAAATDALRQVRPQWWIVQTELGG
ncbi:MAG: 4-(cytidine 5'-diphospho)-2-C-methyl-D-erythritol kinase [Hyphomicrobium sp.]